MRPQRGVGKGCTGWCVTVQLKILPRPDERAHSTFVEPHFAHAIRGGWRQAPQSEQRWKRSTKIADPTYYYYNRFRYKILAYGPIFGPLLETGSLFFCVYNEIFMQAGEKVEFNYYEDNRSYAGVGYGLTDTFHLHIGYMKSFGQLDAFKFRNHDIFRLSIYHKLSLFND